MALPLTRPRVAPGLVAAAASYTSRSTDNAYLNRRALTWQKRALAYLDLVPELAYSSRFYARMLRPLRIYPGTLREDGTIEPITSGMPVEMLSRLKGKDGTSKAILGSYGRLMFTTGEGILLGININTENEYWMFVWNEEVVVERTGDRLSDEVSNIIWKPMGNQDPIEYTPEEARVYRMWTPHPRRSGEADSPMRSVLEIAEELIALTASVRATATSRTVNGVLLMPTEMVPVPAEVTGDEDEESDPFIDEMLQHLEAQVEDAGSAAAASPWVIWGAYELLDRIRMVQLHDPQTDYMERDLRKEAVERMARGMDFPAEYLMGLSTANHWCLPIDNTIMTKDRGWVGCDDLVVGDIVRSLNHETSLAEWEPVLDIYRADVVDEPMLEIENSNHSSLSTMGHRWPVIRGGERCWTTSADIRSSDRIARCAPSADLPREPTYSDEFVELVAWFVTEGTCTWPSEKNCQVRIGQSHISNPGLVAQIRGTLTRMFGPSVPNLIDAWSGGAGIAPAWRETAESRGMTLFNLNKMAYAPLLDVMTSWRSKIISRDFILSLTAGQLDLLLTVATLGDGRATNSGLEINQRDPARLAPIELAAILAGKATNTRWGMTGGFGTKKLQTFLGISSARPMTKVKDKSVVTYTGRIWCPVTKNGTWLTQRNGKVYFTGNSAKQILDSMWRDHGTGIADQYVGDINDAYLRPGLREGGYPNWEDVVIGWDEAAIVVPADQSADADAAHDRGAISDVGYRKLKNIPEEYKPSTEEHDEYLAIKLKNEGILGIEAAATAPTDPSAGPPPPGAEGDSGRRTRVTTAALEMGAAEMALARCRELAGIRIKQKEKICPDCLKDANGQPNSEIAALIGADSLERLSLTPVQLVRGGTDTLSSLLGEWGYATVQAAAISEMVESYAARTIFKSGHQTLPSGFAAQFERAKEASNVSN